MTDSLTLMRAACVSNPTCWQTSAVLFDLAKEAHGDDGAAEVEVWESVLAGIRARFIVRAVRIMSTADRRPRAVRTRRMVRTLVGADHMGLPVDVVPGTQMPTLRDAVTGTDVTRPANGFLRRLYTSLTRMRRSQGLQGLRIVVGAGTVLRLYCCQDAWGRPPGPPAEPPILAL